MASPYRTSSGKPPEPAFAFKRWHLLILFFVAVIAALGIIAGPFTGDVLVALFHTAFVIPVILPAAMLGLLLTRPLVKAKLFAASPWPDVLRLAVGTALGLGAISLGTFLLGVVGLFRNDIPLLLPVIAAGAGFLPMREFISKFDRAPLRTPATKGDLLLLLTAVPLAVFLIASTFPPSTLWSSEGFAYDVREYHLPVPREFLHNNSLAPLPHNVYSFLPGNVELLYLQLMCVAHLVDPSPDAFLSIYPSQFLHAIMMFLTAVIVFLAPLSLPRLGRCLALLAFLGTPWVLVTGSLAYNEAGMLLFGSIALMFALAPPSRTATITTGIALGLAVGCKLTAGTMFAVPVALIMLLQRRTVPLVLVASIALSLYAPWALRAAAYTKNPVFPMATSVFGSGNWWTPAQGKQWDAGHRAPPGFTSPMGRLNGLARESVLDRYWSYAPWSEKSREPRLPGALWLAVGVALVLAVARGPQAWLLLAVVGVQLICWLLFTHLQARFLLPMLVPLVWLIGMAAVPLAAPRAILTISVAVHAVLAGLILLPELGLFLGSKYNLAPAIGTIPIHIIPPPAAGARQSNPGPVLLVGECTPLLYQGRAYYNTVFDANPLLAALRAGGVPAAREYLNARGIRFIGVNFPEISRLASSYGFEPGQVPIKDPAALKAYVQELATLMAPLLQRPTPHEGHTDTVYFMVGPTEVEITTVPAATSTTIR